MRSILIVMILLAGCAGPGPDDTAAPESPVVEPADAPTEPPVNVTVGQDNLASWLGSECLEVHGKFLFDPADYAGIYPPGFSPVLEDGMVIIQTVTLRCSEGHMHLVALLVEPPEERKWAGATHGLLMDEVWFAGANEVLRDAGVGAQNRDLQMTKLGVLSGLGTLIQSEPDFVMDVHVNPTENGWMAEQMRFFGAFWNEETASVGVTSDRALDMIRSPSLSWTGPATAHFLPFLGGGDLPFDQVGTGAGSFETLPISISAVYT